MILEGRALTKVHRTSRGEVRALAPVSLAVAPGEVAVVTGPSGSGKTTLLALLGALERPTTGVVVFDGTDLSGCSDAALARVRRRMGFVFQDAALIPGLTAAENVAWPLIPRGVPAVQRRRAARELLERLGVGPRADAPARDLSGGEAQRVAIARALAGDPAVLLADEPTSHLDAPVAAAFRDVLEERRARGVAVIVSTHDRGAIERPTTVVDLGS